MVPPRDSALRDDQQRSILSASYRSLTDSPRRAKKLGVRPQNLWVRSAVGAAPRRDLGRRPTCRWRGKSRRGRRSYVRAAGRQKSVRESEDPVGDHSPGLPRDGRICPLGGALDATTAVVTEPWVAPVRPGLCDTSPSVGKIPAFAGMTAGSLWPVLAFFFVTPATDRLLREKPGSSLLEHEKPFRVRADPPRQTLLIACASRRQYAASLCPGGIRTSSAR